MSIDFDLKSHKSLNLTKRNRSLTHHNYNKRPKPKIRSESLIHIDTAAGGKPPPKQSINIPKHKWSKIPENTRISYVYKKKDGKTFKVKSAFFIKVYVSRSGKEIMIVNSGDKKWNLPTANIEKVNAYAKELAENLRGGKDPRLEIKILIDEFKILSKKLNLFISKIR